MRSRPLIALIAALAIHLVSVLVSVARSPIPAGDFDRYYEIASTGGRPYVDYQVEHPIGTLVVFKALAKMTRDRPTFGCGIVVADAIADAIIVASLAWGWGATAAAVWAVVVLPVIGLFFNRIDPWSTAAVTVAAATWRRQRPIAPGIALALGGALKMWPLLLAPMLVARPRGARAIGAFFAAAAGLAGLAWWVAGLEGLVQVLTFRGARGWQIESVVGNLIQLSDASTLRMESGSWRIGATSGPVGIAMFLTAAPICLWSAWRGAKTDRLGTGWLAAVSTLLLLSPLFSPQFVIWLGPAAAIAWVEGDRRSSSLAALTIVLTLGFWYDYDAVMASRMPALLTIAARNIAILVLAASALSRLRVTPQAARRRTTMPTGVDPQERRRQPL